LIQQLIPDDLLIRVEDRLVGHISIHNIMVIGGFLHNSIILKPVKKTAHQQTPVPDWVASN
jgi:hypothetical protein